MAVAKQVRAELLYILKNKPWFTPELEKELPSKWEKHGDLVLLPEKTFASVNVWSEYPQVLETTCKLLRCARLARRVGPTQSDNFRSPKVHLLLGDSTWVTKKENGILYSWNLSKCMFSSGNITEKQRIAGWNLQDKTVVDLYAGIGYFTLTYLVHSKAKLVYACEWNPDAVEALTRNLKLNKIDPERCIVLEGDNRLICPRNVADHVNLGLIPSSEDGWITACWALKRDTGGILHVHGNVDVKLPVKDEQTQQTDNCDDNCEQNLYNEWSNHVRSRIQSIFVEIYPTEQWTISVQTVIKIKSYAPRVDHVVADILCEPIKSS